MRYGSAPSAPPRETTSYLEFVRDKIATLLPVALPVGASDLLPVLKKDQQGSCNPGQSLALSRRTHKKEAAT